MSVLIFPEGTRSPDGKLQRGKPGAGLISIKAGVPILPVRSFGFETVLPRSGVLRGGMRITLCAGETINPAEIDADKFCKDRPQVIVDAIMARMATIEAPRVWEV